MSDSLLFDQIVRRTELDKGDGDNAYFSALSSKLEYLTKIVVSGCVACIGDDGSRQRYSLEHKLVRADSLGTWVTCLDEALTGPPSQLVRPGAGHLFKELTQKVTRSDWRAQATNAMIRAAQCVGVSDARPGKKVALRQMFSTFVTHRNRSRGHGATTPEQCAASCAYLSEVCDLVVANLQLFSIPWAYLHRNISGKYRVSPLLGDPTPFAYLKRETDAVLHNGVYMYIQNPISIPFVFSDSLVTDILVANGKYRDGTVQTLSYTTNDAIRRDVAAWSDPPGALPESETEGLKSLDIVGNTFSNVPDIGHGYIPRPILQGQVTQELMITDRHPIVSLTGPGGIGKTTLAISAINEIAEIDQPPYGVILWISARDVDLLDSGPKRVSPRAVTEREVAEAAVALLEPNEAKARGFDPIQYFQQCLLSTPVDEPILFVFDNFETLEHPADVYSWIDTYVRLPNKVLITTRVRSFRGDYHIDVGGMTDEEANALIERHAARLGVSSLMTDLYRKEVISESGGHPYVIKIFLGDVAKEGVRVTPKRVMAGSGELLRALFERTYNSLSPGAQRIFLLLSSWRVSVPQVGVEAVMLRPNSERFDVSAAIDELIRYSLIERIGNRDEAAFVTVSLAAAQFGKRKLLVSPFRSSVEEERRLLLEFGVGSKRPRDEVAHGVYPRIENLLKSVARDASDNPLALANALPILEYLAERVPKAYHRLAELVLEADGGAEATSKAKTYLERFVEYCSPRDRTRVWLQLARLCTESKDVAGEIRALCEAGIATGDDLEGLGYIVKRVNRRLVEIKYDGGALVRTPSVSQMLRMLAEHLEQRRLRLDSDACSGLGWLHLNVEYSQVTRQLARRAARLGLKKDPTNEHCLKLLARLEA